MNKTINEPVYNMFNEMVDVNVANNFVLVFDNIQSKYVLLESSNVLDQEEHLFLDVVNAAGEHINVYRKYCRLVNTWGEFYTYLADAPRNTKKAAYVLFNPDNYEDDTIKDVLQNDLYFKIIRTIIPKFKN